MSYIVTQNDIDVLNQSTRIVYARYELLNANMTILNRLDGSVVSDSWQMDFESDIRRTMSMQLAVSREILDFFNDDTFFLTKYLRVYIGFWHNRSQQILWYPMGIFYFTQDTFIIDHETYTIEVSCNDMMIAFTGDRSGVLPSQLLKVYLGEDWREVVVASMDLAGITKYRIEDPELEIPYDIELATGSTMYDLWVELRDLNVSWEFFFDIDGTFVFQPIAQTNSVPVIADASVVNPLVISESTQRNLNDIKNVTIIYGMSLDAKYLADDCSGSASEYTITIETQMAGLTDGLQIAFCPHVTNKSGARLKISAPNSTVTSYSAMDIVYTNGNPIEAGQMGTDVDYVVRYDADEKNFIYLGQYQIKAVYKETDETNPFSIPNLGGLELTQVFSDGDYAKIYSDQLAMERAEYETWKSTRFQDQIELSMVSIPWFDVNQKFEYTSYKSGESKTYLIQQISMSTIEGTMSVIACPFYSLYPFTT